jgi:meiotically up-regulated gene 157 (Mug157) protein
MDKLALTRVPFVSCRPEIEKRCFRSSAVDARIAEAIEKIADPELAWMFENCFPNTLDTTVRHSGHGPDSFIITGDIDAMWLRDSTAQVWPYLSLADQDASLALMIEGLIRRQVNCILLDPYANAFNDGPIGSQWVSDFTEMKPELHERKWEIDSLCYAVRLSYGFWKATGQTSCFDSRWVSAMSLVIDTFVAQQRKDGAGPYAFMRESVVSTETAPLNGYGNPTKPVGMIHSIFRPSDDACIFPFLIPSNLFAVTSLRQLAMISTEVLGDETLSTRALALADEVAQAVEKYGIHEHPAFGRIYAYEVDGLGGRVFMDDANVPSLLGLPYLDCVDSNDEVYQNTRRFVLSPENPYFFRAEKWEGVGGAHIGPPFIWPMSIIVRALTSDSADEIERCIEMLRLTHAGTGFIHESFHRDDPDNFTRHWFAWANTLFGELILQSIAED